MTDKIIIAIDGVSSTGKSTMAKDLAKELGYTYIDTGAMYRAITLFSLQNGCWDDNALDEKRLEQLLPYVSVSIQYNRENDCQDTYLNGDKVEKLIRLMVVANRVSQVAALKFVREKLVKLQQQMGEKKGIVMDGRDIGTVVFPNAEMKVYVTASQEIRARRRVLELRAKGQTATIPEVLENVRMRDHIDMTREESPLRQASDAIVLDNTNMTIPEQKVWLMEQYKHITSSKTSQEN